jgi:hypothetical protein
MLQVEICSQQLESFAFASRLFRFLVESLSFCFGPGFCLLASDIFFINWTVCMSDNLSKRVQILGHVHIICIIVWEDRIICCQIFCDLLLKSAFERIFNVMQLILVKIKWHIKWKYLIQKFHNICLSYYFKQAVFFTIYIMYISESCSGILNSEMITWSSNLYFYCRFQYFNSFDSFTKGFNI